MPAGLKAFGLAFGEPLWLLLCPLVVAAVVLVTRRRLSSLTPARQRAVLGIRIGVGLAFSMALAQPTARLWDDSLSVVFAIDVSPSISPAAQGAMASWVEQAMRMRRARDRVGAVAFGRDAHVVRPLGRDEGTLLPAAVRMDGTDLEAGLRLAASVARQEGMPRVVLLSDGRQTRGDIEASIDALQGVQLFVVPVTTGIAPPEVILESVGMPPYARVGESFDATLTVASTHSTTALVRVSLDGRELPPQEVKLRAGRNRLSLGQKALEEGFHSLAVQVEAAEDTIAANNVGGGFVITKPRPGVLLIEERAGEADFVRSALQVAEMHLTTISPAELPSLDGLERYAAVVMSNVSATSFSLDQLKTLHAYVESLGHGLVVLGGPTSYALGSYNSTPLEQVLPVSAEVPTKREGARIALLMIIDRSGSMDLKADGVTKMEMAKEAAILATESLRPDDQLGVLAFDMRPIWVVPFEAVGVAGLTNIQNRIASLKADGGTDIYAALERGYQAIRQAPAGLRHIILLSDGQGWEARYEELVGQIRASGVGLSTIAVGGDADQRLMGRLARWGEGRYYFTERIREIPRIVTREAAIAKRSAIVEGAIAPQLASTSSIMRSIAPAELPYLHGYVATTPKESAQVVLASERGEPLLSQWYYGLGRAVAWTSDMSPRWASEWIAWEKSKLLWEQAVRWVMVSPESRDLEIAVSRRGEEVRITADALHEGGFAELADTRAAITGPDQAVTQIGLRQVAPGRYEGVVSTSVPGVYEVKVTQSRPGMEPRSETSGFVVRTADELAFLGADERLLGRLAMQTSGAVIQAPEGVFSTDDKTGVYRWMPIWWYLVALGLVLFVLDVAFRRVASLRYLLATKLPSNFWSRGPEQPVSG